MLDNGSRDGSAQAAREHPAVDEMIALEQRRGKARNDSELLRARARALRAAAQRGLRAAARGHARAVAGAAGASAGAPARARGCCAPTARPQACAWRFPTLATALAGALLLHRPYTVQSRGGARARGRLVPVRGAARAPRGGRAGRLPGPRLLRLLRRGRLRPPPARRRLAQRVRARGRGGPPRAALHRRRARAADRRAGAQPRPVHAQAPLAAALRERCAG